MRASTDGVMKDSSLLGLVANECELTPEILLGGDKQLDGRLRSCGLVYAARLALSELPWNPQDAAWVKGLPQFGTLPTNIVLPQFYSEDDLCEAKVNLKTSPFVESIGWETPNKLSKSSGTIAVAKRPWSELSHSEKMQMADKSAEIIKAMVYFICPITCPHGDNAIFHRTLSRGAIIAIRNSTLFEATCTVLSGDVDHAASQYLDDNCGFPRWYRTQCDVLQNITVISDALDGIIQRPNNAEVELVLFDDNAPPFSVTGKCSDIRLKIATVKAWVAQKCSEVTPTITKLVNGDTSLVIILSMEGGRLITRGGPTYWSKFEVDMMSAVGAVSNLFNAMDEYSVFVDKYDLLNQSPRDSLSVHMKTTAISDFTTCMTPVLISTDRGNIRDLVARSSVLARVALANHTVCREDTVAVAADWAASVNVKKYASFMTRASEVLGEVGDVVSTPSLQKVMVHATTVTIESKTTLWNSTKWRVSYTEPLSDGDKLSIGCIKATIAIVPRSEMLRGIKDPNFVADLMYQISGNLKRVARGFTALLEETGGMMLVKAASGPCVNPRHTLVGLMPVMIQPHFASSKLSIGLSETFDRGVRNNIGTLSSTSSKTIVLDEMSVDTLIASCNFKLLQRVWDANDTKGEDWCESCKCHYSYCFCANPVNKRLVSPKSFSTLCSLLAVSNCLVNVVE